MSSTQADSGRSLTLRSVSTGIVIGALLTPCNVYSGLKIGWSFNMSITAALLSLAFWRLAEDLWRAPAWQLQENVMNQTTASSAASIISGGLVAPIPALALLTGQTLDWPSLALWVFSVSALGIVVAAIMRRPMLVREKLVFPAGVATAETVREIHSRGAEAVARVRMLAGAAVASGGLKLLVDSVAITRWSPGGAVGGVGFKSLGFSLDPSLLMVGFGAIIGLRAGLSLLLGAVIAWMGLAPWILDQGWAAPGAADAAWFGPLVEWLLWPGVTLMTVASLVSFARTLMRNRAAATAGNDDKEPAVPLPRRWFLPAAAAAFVLAVATQWLLFDLPPLLGVLAVVLAFVLAVVAARVVGETGIPPIGAIGKVSQLSFGVAAPSDVTMNLMGANVTGGAAGQCADLLNDLRAGQLLGSSPAKQIVAQCFGVLTGSLVGSFAYLVLIPDPVTMLLTEQWPAPAVATWKAVAEVLAIGLQAIPEGSGPAMAVAALVGLLLALAPSRINNWLPSGTALGLAFVIPAWISISLALGAVMASLAARFFPQWSARFVLALAAGLVAGESMAGIGSAFFGLIGAG